MDFGAEHESLRGGYWGEHKYLWGGSFGEHESHEFHESTCGVFLLIAFE